MEKIRCQGCGRKVKNDPQAKLQHVMTYHQNMVFARIAGLFNPALFEYIGRRFGERVRGML